jgi:hypothetical protein
MKKMFTLAALLLAASAVNAQFITKALDANDESTFKWENASNYILISVGEAEREAMEGKILADYSIDDVNVFMYIWPGGETYAGGDGTGINSFGQLEDHTALVVTGFQGWSGGGIVMPAGADFSMLDDSYVLHFGIKGKPNDNASHGFGFGEGKFSIGPTAFIDGGNPMKLLGDFERNNEWYYVDIPFSVLKQCAADGQIFPINYGGPAAYTSNIFWFLSGGVQGTELHIDNIFIYKDATIVPETPDYVLHYGTIGSDWQDVTFVAGEGENEGKFIAENVEFAANTEFKVNYGDLWYGGASLDSAYLIHSEWCENIPLDAAGANFRINEAGTYTFILDVAEDGIKMTVTGWPEPEQKLYLIGDAPLGGWDPAAPIEMTEADGVFTYTATIEEAKDYYFVFTTATGTWADVNGHRYGPTEANQDVVLGEEIATQLSTNDQAAYKLAAEAGEYTFTFDMANLKFKVDKIGTPGIPGDANGDGLVDISDVNSVINQMLGKEAMIPACDMNGDGKIDISDVNAVINKMLGK